MAGPHGVEPAGSNDQLFALLWGLHLGDQFQVVGDQVFSVLEGLRARQSIDPAVLDLAFEDGLIEAEDRDGGTVTRLTERGRYQLHKWGVKRMGRKAWERERRERRWLLKGFDIDGAVARMFAKQEVS